MSNPASNDNHRAELVPTPIWPASSGTAPTRSHGIPLIACRAMLSRAQPARRHRPAGRISPAGRLDRTELGRTRRCPGEDRRNLIRSCAITDRSRLLASALTLA